MEENTNEVTNEQPTTDGIENPEGEESGIEVPPTGEGQPVGDPAADPLNDLIEIVKELKDELKEALKPEENPQIYKSVYQNEDYAITLVHEITLGDMLLGTLVTVLIVVVLLSRLLGGARRW